MSAIKTEQELRDEFDILSIEERIEWALNTIRDKETFGLDQLNASLSRERRAKGVLLDCKKEIQQLKQQLESMTNKCAELNYDKNCLISDLNQSRENERQLKQQLESTQVELLGVTDKLKEAVEVISKVKFSSGFFIDDHNSKDAYLLASEFLAKYKSLENNVTEH